MPLGDVRQFLSERIRSKLNRMGVEIAKDEEPIFVFQSCGHMFHEECAKRYVETCISNSKIPIRCLEPSCKCVATVGDIRQLVSADMMVKYYDRSLSLAI